MARSTERPTEVATEISTELETINQEPIVLETKKIIIDNQDVIISRVKEFYKQITSDDKAKRDTLIELKPFIGMETSLSSPPLAMAALGKLNLIATNPDFSLQFEGDRKIEYHHLRVPSSFKASVNQVSDESYWAFRKAHNGMNAISLMMAQVEDLISDAVKILYSVNPIIIKDFLPIPLNEVKRIADQSKTHVEEIVDKNEEVLNILQEMNMGATARLGDAEQLAVQKKGVAQLAAIKKVQAERAEAEATEW